jgi:hypothetical protein
VRLPRAAVQLALRPLNVSLDELSSRLKVRRVAQRPEPSQAQLRERAAQCPVAQPLPEQQVSQ